MKVITVVGARPQFIKAAAVSRVIRRYVTEILVHTGQHYDSNMSDVFFEELSIPHPDYHLGVGSGSHAKQTADIMVRMEEICQKEKPDYVLVYGDTNSTLAAALAAAKLLIPVIHVEAGLRSFNKAMPEEQNRILTDHISEYLFCPTDTAVEHLSEEGICKNVYQIGDVMCDAVRFYLQQLTKETEKSPESRMRKLYPYDRELQQWYLATVHRAENTMDEAPMRSILAALESLEYPVVFPVHPRIRGYVDQLVKENGYQNICFTEPLGYLEMLYFTSHAKKVVTDSGGLQKEAYMMHRNVVTLRDQTEWVETLRGNHNILCTTDTESICRAVERTDIEDEFDDSLYGGGDAAEKMCSILWGK